MQGLTTFSWLKRWGGRMWRHVPVDGNCLCVASVAGIDAPERCHKGRGTGGRQGRFSFSLKSLQTAKWVFCFLVAWYGNRNLLKCLLTRGKNRGNASIQDPGTFGICLRSGRLKFVVIVQNGSADDFLQTSKEEWKAPHWKRRSELEYSWVWWHWQVLKDWIKSPLNSKVGCRGLRAIAKVPPLFSQQCECTQLDRKDGQDEKKVVVILLSSSWRWDVVFPNTEETPTEFGF